MAFKPLNRPPKTCEQCGQPYHPKQRYAASRFCSQRCSHAARPRAARVVAGRKGGRTRAANLVRHSPQALRLANERQKAYRLGYGVGLDKGYELAMRRLGYGGE